LQDDVQSDRKLTRERLAPRVHAPRAAPASTLGRRHARRQSAPPCRPAAAPRRWRAAQVWSSRCSRGRTPAAARPLSSGSIRVSPKCRCSRAQPCAGLHSRPLTAYHRIQNQARHIRTQQAAARAPWCWRRWGSQPGHCKAKGRRPGSRTVASSGSRCSRVQSPRAGGWQRYGAGRAPR